MLITIPFLNHNTNKILQEYSKEEYKLAELTHFQLLHIYMKLLTSYNNTMRFCRKDILNDSTERWSKQEIEKIQKLSQISRIRRKNKEEINIKSPFKEKLSEKDNDSISSITCKVPKENKIKGIFGAKKKYSVSLDESSTIKNTVNANSDLRALDIKLPQIKLFDKNSDGNIYNNIGEKTCRIKRIGLHKQVGLSKDEKIYEKNEPLERWQDKEKGEVYFDEFCNEMSISEIWNKKPERKKSKKKPYALKISLPFFDDKT